MPRGTTLDADSVVWFAPETLNQTEFAEKLAAVSDPNEALEILNSRPTVGEFRVQTEQATPQPGPEGTTVLGPEFGDRAVWVDENPDDREDGSGHFEVYDPERHGEPYNPTFRKGA